MNRIAREIYNFFAHFDMNDRQTWIVLFAVVIGVGLICLKGFGQRI